MILLNEHYYQAQIMGIIAADPRKTNNNKAQ
jgi:hypothetical protein